MPIEVINDPSNATLNHAAGQAMLGAGQVKYAYC